MSLDDLLAHYTSDSPLDERHALLEAMATRLPAPEFLWYDLAMQALHGDEDELKIPAIGLLAHASRSWHQVLMTALTDGEVNLQLAALKALHAHALADNERRDAFAALGELPGWRVESLSLWKNLCVALSGLPVSDDAAAEALPVAGWPRLPNALLGLSDGPNVEVERLEVALHVANAAVEELESRVLDLEAENFMLREDRARLHAAFEAENRRAQSLQASLDALRDRHEALHFDMVEQIERLKLEGDQKARHYLVEVTGLQGTLDQARVRSRRTLTAGLLSLALLAAVGGPIGYSFVSHASVMAMSPEDLPAGKHSAAHHKPVKESVKNGAHATIASLTAEATALEAAAKPEQALAKWETVIVLARTPEEAREAQQAAQTLRTKLASEHPVAPPPRVAPTPMAVAHPTGSVATRRVPIARPRAVAKAVSKSIIAHRKAAAVSVPGTGLSARGAAPVRSLAVVPNSLSIPAAIRAKF
jgi:hypothetical protein